jgi:hypothetical protein
LVDPCAGAGAAGGVPVVAALAGEDDAEERGPSRAPPAEGAPLAAGCTEVGGAVDGASCEPGLTAGGLESDGEGAAAATGVDATVGAVAWPGVAVTVSMGASLGAAWVAPRRAPPCWA